MPLAVLHIIGRTKRVSEFCGAQNLSRLTKLNGNPPHRHKNSDCTGEYVDDKKRRYGYHTRLSRVHRPPVLRLMERHSNLQRKPVRKGEMFTDVNLRSIDIAFGEPLDAPMIEGGFEA